MIVTVTIVILYSTLFVSLFIRYKTAKAKLNNQPASIIIPAQDRSTCVSLSSSISIRKTSIKEAAYASSNNSHIGDDKKIKRAIYRLMLYPIGYVIIGTGGMVNRMLESYGEATEGTRLLQCLTNFLPLMDAIIYTATIRDQFPRVFWGDSN